MTNYNHLTREALIKIIVDYKESDKTKKESLPSLDKIESTDFVESEKVIHDLEPQISNNNIMKEALVNRSKMLDIKSKLVNLKESESEHFVEMMKELHFMKKQTSKTSLMLIGALSVTFYLLGTQHEIMYPHIVKIFNVFNYFTGGA